MKIKNRITLYTGIGEEKQRVDLFDFDTLDHYCGVDGRYYYRITCGDRFYYFPLAITSIAEIKNYN